MAWASTLVASVTPDDTRLRLSAVPGTFRLSSTYFVIDPDGAGEIVAARGVGADYMNVERGILGTTAASHAAGVSVVRYSAPLAAAVQQAPAAEHPDLATHVGLGLSAQHAHPYADTVHAHPHDHDGTYSASGHSHPAGAHPDLTQHEAIGLATAHAHPYAITSHNHDAAYSGTSHNHDAAYSATGHGHVHNHDSAYSAAGHVHAGGGANVKSGLVNLPAGGSAVVTFATPFQGIPRVVVTSAFNSADTSTTISVFPISTSGFTIRGAGNAAGTVAWIATDAGNP